jgi:hypothetical protein
MCERAEVKEIMDQGVTALKTELVLLKTKQEEYQRSLAIHMDNQQKWYTEMREIRETALKTREEMMAFERTREAVHREMEDRIISKVRSQDKEDRSAVEKAYTDHVDAKISGLRTSLLQYMGFGGLVAVGSIVFYFGGLGERVENHDKSISSISAVVNTGSVLMKADASLIEQRATAYVDVQNAAQDARIARIEDSVNKGFEEIKNELREIKR